MTKKGIFSFFFSMFLILIMANPALTQDKGICVGGGEWAALPPYSGVGNTAFSMRVNFLGNASGGYVHVSSKDGEYYLVDVDPDFSIILDGVWLVGDTGDSVSGDAFWGIGPVVDTNIMDLPENPWALVGAYDGSESDEKDYLFALPRLNYELALTFWNASVAGYIPFAVELIKGNVTINVMEE